MHVRGAVPRLVWFTLVGLVNNRGNSYALLSSMPWSPFPHSAWSNWDQVPGSLLLFRSLYFSLNVTLDYLRLDWDLGLRSLTLDLVFASFIILEGSVGQRLLFSWRIKLIHLTIRPLSPNSLDVLSNVPLTSAMYRRTIFQDWED